jgi:hypothetical protein
VDWNEYQLSWTFEDEGLNGTFDPDDPEDTPLLRFTIYRREEDGAYHPVDDCSYCTMVELGASKDTLRGAGSAILRLFIMSDNKKRAMELMSWLNIPNT